MNRLVAWLLTAAIAAREYSCHYASKGGASGDIDAPTAAGGAAHSHSHGGGLFLVAFGLLMFYGARQNYRKLRTLEASPIKPIRDLVAGLVHVIGKAAGSQTLTSPLARQACFYYQVLVERRGGRGDWALLMRHIGHTSFDLQDETGQVAVDLHGAQLDLTQVFQREIDAKGGPASIGGTGPSGDDLRDYLMRVNAQIHADLAARRESVVHALAQTEGSVSMLPANFSPRDSGLRLRFTETCLLADQQYNILGTCIDNPDPGGDDDRRLIARGPKQNTFLISCNSEPMLEKQTLRGVYLTLAAGGVLFALGLAIFIL
ncbi:MAG TPA: hypothetical protein VKG05_00980 [Steroidobacteraceae bacterium]|nr:hypothetical protein [Steroidobacteraceae bacterium]